MQSNTITNAANQPQTGSGLIALAALGAYLLIGFAVFFNILGMSFVADDYPFLHLVATAPSVGVVFSPLAERYFRPAVVFLYYVNYQLAGLSPVPYHVTLLLVHICNTWLIFLLARRVSPGRLLVPALSGLLFLLFGGHAEAVSWTAGAADPLLTLFILLGLVLFLRSLEPGASRWWIAGVWLTSVGAVLSKELSVVFPGLLVVCGALSKPGWPDRATVRRTLAAISFPVLLLIGYPLVRSLVLGFPFVTLAGLGTSPDLLISARRFLLRSFIPPGWMIQVIWYRLLDVLVVAPVALILLWWRDPRTDYRLLALFALCFALALGPMVPLSISLATTESERFIYLATVFASLLTVYFADAVLRHRGLLVAAVLIWCAVHVHALTRSNHTLREAATMTEETLRTFREVVLEHGKVGAPIFLLNAVDDVRGAYVYRRGFHEALALTSPDLGAYMAQTHVLSVYIVTNVANAVTVAQRERTVDVDLGAGTALIGPPTASTRWFKITRWETNRFTVEFTAAASDSLIIYFTPTRTAVVGRVP